MREPSSLARGEPEQLSRTIRPRTTTHEGCRPEEVWRLGSRLVPHSRRSQPDIDSGLLAGGRPVSR